MYDRLWSEGVLSPSLPDVSKLINVGKMPSQQQHQPSPSMPKNALKKTPTKKP